MSVSPRPLWIALAAGAMVALGAVGWLARELSAEPSGGHKRPSLLELLEEVRHPPQLQSPDGGPPQGHRNTPAGGRPCAAVAASPIQPSAPGCSSW